MDSGSGQFDHPGPQNGPANRLESRHTRRDGKGLVLQEVASDKYSIVVILLSVVCTSNTQTPQRTKTTKNDRGPLGYEPKPFRFNFDP